MATTYKTLAQAVPVTPGVDVNLYTVAALTTAVVSTFTVCNQAAAAATFRLAVAVAGLAATAKQYIYYDIAIAGNDTFAATLGITLAATDVVRVNGSATTLSFNLFGSEII